MSGTQRPRRKPRPTPPPSSGGQSAAAESSRPAAAPTGEARSKVTRLIALGAVLLLVGLAIIASRLPQIELLWRGIPATAAIVALEHSGPKGQDYFVTYASRLGESLGSRRSQVSKSEYDAIESAPVMRVRCLPGDVESCQYFSRSDYVATVGLSAFGAVLICAAFVLVFAARRARAALRRKA